MSHFSIYVFHDENTSVDDLLAKYYEGLELDEPVLECTKEEAIANQKDVEIGEWARTCYESYIKDPCAYSKGCSELHIEWVKEYPTRVDWSDEEFYNRYIDGIPNKLIAENGDVLTYRNPNAKWDWYVKGGRWSGDIPNDEIKVGEIGENGIPTPYAYIAPNGEWFGRNEMGWFGCSKYDEDAPKWDEHFKEYIKTVPKDIIVTQVDCHI